MSWAGVQRNGFQLSMRPRPAARTLSLEPGKKAAARKVQKGCKDWQEPGRKLRNRLGFFVAAYPRGPQGDTSEDYDPVRSGHVEGHRGKEGGVSL